MWHYVSKVSHYLNTCRTESILINIQIFTLSLIFQHRDGSSSQNLSLWMTRYRIHVGGIIHYSDVIMGATASQITSLLIVYSTVYSGADQRKHQNSASLDFERGIHRWPVNSPHKGPVTRKIFPFNDVIMNAPGIFMRHLPMQINSWPSVICCFCPEVLSGECISCLILQCYLWLSKVSQNQWPNYQLFVEIE